jgi:putative ABC transport system ATP-binding protein
MTLTQEPDGTAPTAPSSLSSSLSAVALSVRDARCVVPADDGGTRTIFEGINLDIIGGHITDITGPSGCGKSTLLTTIARLNPGGSARMSLDGTDSTTMNPQQWRLRVAYVNQRPVLMGETIRETLLFPWTLAVRKDDAGAARPTDDELRQALDRAGLADISLDRPVHDVSGGQYARVALLRTLLTRPRVLLADEVDAALDDASDAQIEKLIAEAAQAGMAVVRVRHRASDGLEDRLLRLENSTLTDITGAVSKAVGSTGTAAGTTAASADAGQMPDRGTPSSAQSGTNAGRSAR